MVARARIRALPGLRAAILAAVATATALGGSGCAASHTGHLFARISDVSAGAKPVRPGAELGMYYLLLRNTSASTITISSISLRGPGIGSVARVVEVKIAPLRLGYHRSAPGQGAPGGLYVVDPPAFQLRDGCSLVVLRPVRGFRMTPGAMARVWFVVRALRPGRWSIPAHVVSYTADGVSYRQSFSYRAYGSVASDARYIPIDPGEAPCVGPDRARLLAGHHLGS